MKISNAIIVTSLIALSRIAHADADAGASYEVGSGAAYVPRYAGSKDYRIAPQLNASARFANGFFADTAQGVGYQFQWTDKLRVLASLGLDPGRKDRDDLLRPGADSLKGMGDIKQTALGNLGMGYTFNDRSDVSVLVSQPIGHAGYGTTAHLTGHVVAWRGHSDSVDLDGGLHLGNRRYNQTYFGVTAAQSEASGFARFRPRRGVVAVDGTASWTHQFDKHWFTQASVGVVHYLGSVNHSPIMRESTALVAATSIDYRF